MRYTKHVSVGEAASRPGKLGRYELITQIGQGGMAEVQLALQRGPAGFEKLVVVKLVHENLATQRAFVDMLLDEARVAALVKHPNVVDIYDLGEANGRYFIAMEYLEGEPLLAVLRAGREGKRLDPLSTARLIADTAEGLDAAHELRSMGGDPIELVHHDVSLGNIVVLYNGQVKLVDFGVAKATMTAAAQQKIQGKFSYMAPEKLKGGSGDRRSDIWSLGVVLWEALTLRRLFKGGNDAETMKQVLEQKIPGPSKVNGEVLADFDPIVIRALERDPEKRYPTAKAMAQDLEEVLRKQGYGGRNDQIAKYMQATFDTHIAARKKLLQEVSSKGRASAAVLEAAFAEPVQAIRTTGDFSIAFKGGPAARPAVTAEGTPSEARAVVPTRSVKPSIPPPRPGLPPPRPIVDNDTTTVDARPISDDAQLSSSEDPIAAEVRARRPEAAPVAALGGDSAATVITEAPVFQTAPTKLPTAPNKNKRILLAAAAGGGLLLLILIIVLARGGGGDSKTKVDAAVALAPDAARVAETPDAAAIDPPVVDAAEQPADADEPITIEDAKINRPPRIDAGRRPPPPPDASIERPKVDVAELTQEGLRDLGTGNYPAAVISFRRVLQAAPGHSPAWRGLGMAYEKLGNSKQAISAYTTYLARNPGDQAIKDRLDKLKNK